MTHLTHHTVRVNGIRYAKDHPKMLDRLVVMDNVPTRIIFERMNAEVARGH